MLLQVEQAVFRGDINQLSTEGQTALREDVAWQEVIGGVRVHGGLKAFRQANAIIDYSALNVAEFKRIPDIKSQKLRFFSVAPVLGNNPDTPGPRKKVTVATMYGSPNRGRRGKIAEKLKSHHQEISNISNFENYGVAFQDTAILLNFHQVEHFSTPEELRILPALLQRVIVITEDTLFARRSLCSDFLIFATEGNLASVLSDVQSHYSEYWSKIFGDKRFPHFIETLVKSNRDVANTIMREIVAQKRPTPIHGPLVNKP